mgnify:CR=1 FL=1
MESSLFSCEFPFVFFRIEFICYINGFPLMNVAVCLSSSPIGQHSFSMCRSSFANGKHANSFLGKTDKPRHLPLMFVVFPFYLLLLHFLYLAAVVNCSAYVL